MVGTVYTILNHDFSPVVFGVQDYMVWSPLNPPGHVTFKAGPEQTASKCTKNDMQRHAENFWNTTRKEETRHTRPTLTFDGSKWYRCETGRNAQTATLANHEVLTNATLANILHSSNMAMENPPCIDEHRWFSIEHLCLVRGFLHCHVWVAEGSCFECRQAPQ